MCVSAEKLSRNATPWHFKILCGIMIWIVLTLGIGLQGYLIWRDETEKRFQERKARASRRVAKSEK